MESTAAAAETMTPPQQLFLFTSEESERYVPLIDMALDIVGFEMDVLRNCATRVRKELRHGKCPPPYRHFHRKVDIVTLRALAFALMKTIRAMMNTSAMHEYEASVNICDDPFGRMIMLRDPVTDTVVFTHHISWASKDDFVKSLISLRTVLIG